MENFISRLVELVKGTGANMKRGLDGTAMEEMQASERARNAELLNRAQGGGVPPGMREQAMRQSFPAPPSNDPYVQSLRSLLTKP